MPNHLKKVNEKRFSMKKERDSRLSDNDEDRTSEIFNSIHEEIYSKGGIKPVNAAIDEIGKLLFIRVHLMKNPNYIINTGTYHGLQLKDIFRSKFINENSTGIIDEFKKIFTEINQLIDYKWHNYVGKEESFFPPDEPFRLVNSDVLCSIVEKLNRIWDSFDDTVSKTKTPDLFGQLYEILLRGKYDGSGGLGTYLTPTEVTECMVQMALNYLLSEHEGTFDGAFIRKLKIGDICCGTARFLISALNILKNWVLQNSSFSEEEKLDLIRHIKKQSFFGADQSSSSISKARINFLLYDCDFSKLNTVEDSLYDSQIDDLVNSFSLLLTNPPFGDNKYTNPKGLEKMRQRSQGLELGWSLKESAKPIKNTDPAILFLDRNIQLLEPNGVLSILIPDGLLSNKLLIKYLFGEYNKEQDKVIGGKAIPIAIVSLPTTTFSISGAVAKTSFLMLRKKDVLIHEREPNQVFFAIAEHVGFLKKGNIAVMDDEGNDLATISQLFKSFLNDKENFRSEDKIHATSVSERYKFVTLDPINYHKKIDFAKEIVINSGFPLEKLGNLTKIRDRKSIKRDDSVAYYVSILHITDLLEIDWDAAKLYKPLSNGQLCFPGDILVSCINPRITRVAVIPPNLHAKILCSAEFVVLEPNEGVDPYYVSLILNLKFCMEQIVSKATGTSSSRRRLKKEYIKEILIPIIGIEDRQYFSAELKQSLVELSLARRRKNELLDQINKLIDKTSNS